MRSPRRHQLTTAVVLLPLLALLATLPAGAGSWKRLDVAATGSYAQRYLPSGLDPGEAVPVVVFLHGSGATPEQWKSTLAPVADAVGCALLVPRSISSLGFGVGADDATIRGGLELLEAERPVDLRRVGIAGHSAGGAYALVLAYAPGSRFSGVFSLSAPYRTVLRVSDPDYTTPALLYYGTEDPNYQSGHYEAIRQQLERLGVAVTTRVETGFGHSSWPADTLAQGFAFTLAQPYAGTSLCVPTDSRLCLRGGRFAVEANWRDFRDRTGVGHRVEERSADSGMLWFFRDSNWELLVKVLDGCPVNGHYWVFASATTNVEYTLKVTDLEAGASAEYPNALGVSSAAVTDVVAFDTCP